MNSIGPKNVSVVFCPKSANCGVNKAWLLLENFKEDHHYKFAVEKWYDKFVDVFEAFFQHKELPTSNFIFAHGYPMKFGFETFTNKVLNSPWWLDGSPYEIGIFHACNGAQVLVHPAWRDIFVDWVSYKADLPIAFGLETDKRWHRTFVSMINVANEVKTGQQIKEEFKIIYCDELSKLRGLPFGSGGELMKVHITRALNSIVTKSEN